MKYQGIRKIHEGRFITRYDVDYVTAEGRPKTYEMISRDPDIRTPEDLRNDRPNVVTTTTAHPTQLSIFAYSLLNPPAVS